MRPRCRKLGVGAALTMLASLPRHAMAQDLAVRPQVGSNSDLASFEWNIILVSVIFGAIGGVIYELISSQGNVERPHRTQPDELPATGFPHAKAQFLYDLGILSRIVIGAAAALIVYWAIPVEAGIRLIAVALIAGSAGTAIFRSMQDRLLAAVSAAKLDAVATSLQALQTELDGVQAMAQDPTLARIRGQVGSALAIAHRDS